jgi:hypothetical protein
LPRRSCRPAAWRKRIIRFAIALSVISAAGWPWRGAGLHAVCGAVRVLARHRGGHRHHRHRRHAAGRLLKEFAAGVIANAGTLGILIPPSIVMVVYSAATDVSVGRMFLAGVIPGIVAGLMLMIAIYVVARFKNLPAKNGAGFGEILAGGKEAGWGLFLIIIIIGGIYGGVFTPTEAAAVAAVYSFFIARLRLSRHGADEGRALGA